MTTTAERVLPHSLDAERSILGAVLVDPRVMDAVSDDLSAAVFYRQAHQWIFEAYEALYAKGIAIDFITVQDQLRRSGHLEDVGGPAYVASLTDGVPKGTNVEYYAGIVKRTAAKRSLIKVASTLLENAYTDDTDTADLIHDAELKLLQIGDRTVPGGLQSAETMARDIFPVLEALWDTKRPVTGISTGLPTLDRYTRGLQNGNLVIIGGRPGHGKSTLVLQLALHVARSVPVAFFSLEMSQQEQMFRILASLAMVDGHHLQCGQLSMYDQEQVGHAIATFGERQFWHDETESLSALQIRSRARRLKAHQGLGLIVVDYLQLLTHPKADSREERVAATCRLLKKIARELKVPLVALSQLARPSDRGKQPGRPQLSDLRESGAIEQDADVVVFIHRPPEKSDGIVTETPPVELIIAKQRNGPTTTIDLKWLSEQYRFAELETRQ